MFGVVDPPRLENGLGLGQRTERMHGQALSAQPRVEQCAAAVVCGLSGTREVESDAM